MFILASEPELHPLDRGLLLPPLEVLPFPIGPEEPAFCAEEGWLEAEVGNLRAGLEQEETNLSRVHPTAFIRCSRGGKTRVLLELNKLLREQLPNVAVVYVSFNNFSSLEPWELRDPLGALCRRIAFSALKQRDATAAGFRKFRRTCVSEKDIEDWLGGTPCILLIDELNVLELDAKGAPLVAGFLKKCFLFTRGRYFAFSSHVVPRGQGLSDFMDSISERGIVIHQLPLIPSMADAREKFAWPDLTVRQALLRGRVPALISYTRGSMPHPFDKRKTAIAEVFHDWNDENLKELLRSFLSGQPSCVPQPLLQVMSVASVDDEGLIVWIPYHMAHVLKSIGDSERVGRGLREVVITIQDMFHGFETGKTSGGDSWEALFAIAVMIRLATGSFHRLLNLSAALPAVFGLSYNLLWKQQEDDVAFPDITTLDQLMRGLTKPLAYPHVAVYYPPHARFQIYDLIVVVHQAADARTVFGYQLKEGREIPAKMASDVCECSYVVRGCAAEQKNLLRGWVVASDGEMDEFLGVTGSVLAPKQWRKLAK